ncbi:hypothetical protein D5085_18170 [Ectothiorhodospiraceae bacterium BW-2]|nr:hypothetical protein D5085_18170 [Ectothiorhodospiraceae bacterium BW-2]
MLKQTIAATALGLLVACSITPEQKASLYIKDAQSDLEIAKSKGYSGSDASNSLQQAQAQLAKGQYGPAITLAKQSQFQSAEAIMHADAMEMIQAAKAMLKQAGNHAWRDTGKMIQQAQELFDQKRYADSLVISQQAKRQSELALAQYAQYKGAADRF